MADARQIRSNGRKIGIMQEYGAILRIPLLLMVEINATGNGMNPSRMNGLKIIKTPLRLFDIRGPRIVRP
jgi:hypothetical protein